MPDPKFQNANPHDDPPVTPPHYQDGYATYGDYQKHQNAQNYANSQGFQGYQGSQVYQGYQSYENYQNPGYQTPPQAGAPIYPMSETDRTLRLIAFIFNIISLISACWAIIPLAWMIPMCVISWRIYQGTRANTVAFGVCTLLFVSLVGGILLLCSKKEVPGVYQ